ncbi:hypothetical protein Pelo_16355 [Pelomyxa schiedti]|nr:hypothetical protein Pelo_16355 [Pelomyxa schiedti]
MEAIHDHLMNANNHRNLHRVITEMVDGRWALEERDVDAIIAAKHTDRYSWDPDLTVVVQIPGSLQACHATMIFSVIMNCCQRIDSGAYVPITFERYLHIPPNTAWYAFHTTQERNYAITAIQAENFHCHAVTPAELLGQHVSVEPLPFHHRVAAMTDTELRAKFQALNLTAPTADRPLAYWKKILLTLMIIWRGLAPAVDPCTVLVMDGACLPGAVAPPPVPPALLAFMAND